MRLKLGRDADNDSAMDSNPAADVLRKNGNVYTIRVTTSDGKRRFAQIYAVSNYSVSDSHVRGP